MTETGKVTKIDGNLITLSCKPFPACHSCGGKICSVNGRDISARNPRGIRLKTGDYAEISVPASKMTGPILRVFGLPIAAFAAAYAAAPYVLGDTEKVRVLAGLAGCLAGALAAFLLGKAGNVFPEVLQVVPAPETGSGACPDG